MSIEAERIATEFDISDLDKVDAVLEPCGHKLRVKRHRIGETQPCARCEIETGTLTRAVIAPDGPLPPARRGYRPPSKRGFVTEFTVSDALRRAWVREKVDTRTATEKIEQAERIAAERERKYQARYNAGFDLIRDLVKASETGRVTRSEYDTARGDLPSAESLVKGLGQSWSHLVREAGGVPACSRGRASIKVTPSCVKHPRKRLTRWRRQSGSAPTRPHGTATVRPVCRRGPH